MGKARRERIARAEAGLIWRDGQLVKKEDWLKKTNPDQLVYERLLAEYGEKPPWRFFLLPLRTRVTILQDILEKLKKKTAPAVPSGSPSQGA